MLFFIIPLLCGNAFGQDIKKLDSLLRVLDTQPENREKLRTFERISRYYLNNNTAKAIAYYTRELTLANKLHSVPDMARVYYLMGGCYQVNGDFNKSLDMLTGSAKLYGQLNDKPQLEKVYIEMANVFLINGMHNNARLWLDSAERIIKQTKDSARLCVLYTYRGTMYDDKPPYDSAMYYYKKELNLARLIQNKHYEIGAMENMANTYRRKKNNALALLYYDTVLIKTDTAAMHGGASKDHLSQLYNAIAITWLQAGSNAKAMTFFNKSLNLAKQIDQKGLEAQNYGDMANVYAGFGDYKQQSLYLSKYYMLKDSLINVNSKNQLTQTEADYQLEKKNLSLVKAEAEKNAKTRERNLLIAFVAVLMLLSIYIYVLQQKKYRQQQLLNNVHLEQQKKELALAAEQLQELAYRIADKNELIEILQNHINHEGNTDVITQLQKSNILTNHDWEKFKCLFETVHGGYLSTLHKKIHGISPAEVRFMALAKLGFSNKEMASALGVSPQSMRVTWHRLRKKLDLPDETTIEELVARII